jgi:hypothetical protein
MAALDTLRLESSLGKAELAILLTLKVGTKLKSKLFPALPTEIEWICTAIEGTNWELEGRFCGILYKILVLTQTETTLVLSEKVQSIASKEKPNAV